MLIDKEIRDHENEIEKLQQEIVDLQEIEEKNSEKSSYKNDIRKVVKDYEN